MERTDVREQNRKMVGPILGLDGSIVVVPREDHTEEDTDIRVTL
jgi:hypothetical protein